MITRTWRSLDGAGRALVGLVVLFAIVVCFGIQQTYYQKARDERDACMERWGDALIQAVQVGRATNVRLMEAETRRDDAVDDIMLVALDMQASPPKATQGDLAHALVEFARAKVALVREQQIAKESRAEYKFPPLNC